MADDNPLANVDPDELSDIITQVKGRVGNLTLMALEQAEFIMEHGLPKDKLRVMSTVIPTLVKSLAEVNQDNALEEMRKEMQQVREEVLGAGRAAAIPTSATVEGEEGDLRGSAIPASLMPGASPAAPTGPGAPNNPFTSTAEVTEDNPEDSG